MSFTSDLGSSGSHPAVVTIGDELTLGERDGGNRRWLLERLATTGHPAELALSLPDDSVRIAYWIRLLRERGCLPVLVAGGIGGTHDDCTRQGVAMALGRRLTLHTECDALLATHYGERYTRQRRRMAELPEGCSLLPNPRGAPGFVVDGVYGFPGFPEMMRPMVEAVLARLPPSGDTRQVVREVTLPFVEGDIACAVERFVTAHPQADVGIYPVAGGGPAAVVLRLRAPHDNAVVQRGFDALIEQLRAELG